MAKDKKGTPIKYLCLTNFIPCVTLIPINCIYPYKTTTILNIGIFSMLDVLKFIIYNKGWFACSMNALMQIS